jgi:hypothetical protein
MESLPQIGTLIFLAHKHYLYHSYINNVTRGYNSEKYGIFLERQKDK